ncbi:acyl-ACP--UDP-N-acetylglucosamine O-acyltransferase [Mesorhizobium xinjiangense]|uniref:acyl-ACP--UDP-N-acetylglucosamine O-acyltransferase n=1 Tax=Mesorhizobium xinjiangense TaxID=2678685 RepID=UPI0012EE5B69|nr:acyl-ACP--UDP-N-acetylglucosamine O-acyltransferase [Mesorhizobium xinjiangense]
MTGNETTIHPSAVVEPGAQLGTGVRIGPFCHVGPDVVVGDNCELVGHVSVTGKTTIGKGAVIHPQAALGRPAQDAKHKGAKTALEIGENCIIRECVTMHCGSDASTGRTVIGDDGFFLAYSHVAHDCVVGRNAVFANGATLGGHCQIGDFVYIGGLTAVHQNVRVGDRAFLGGCSAVVGDVIPYGMAAGNRAKLRGFNVVGMRRQGMARADIMRMREAYRVIFDPQRPLKENLEIAARDFADTPLVGEIVGFMKQGGKRYFIVPPLKGDADEGDEAV